MGLLCILLLNIFNIIVDQRQENDIHLRLGIWHQNCKLSPARGGCNFDLKGTDLSMRCWTVRENVLNTAYTQRVRKLETNP